MEKSSIAWRRVMEKNGARIVGEDGTHYFMRDKKILFNVKGFTVYYILDFVKKIYRDVQYEYAKRLGADVCGISTIERFKDAPKRFHPRDVHEIFFLSVNL